MVDFDAMYNPPDPPECEHKLCDFCQECHIKGCFCFEVLCDSARAELRKLVVPQQIVYLSEEIGLCVVRDVTLESLGSQQGTITVLCESVAVYYSPIEGGCYVLAKDHSPDVEACFPEAPTQEEQERHRSHKEQNIYQGACHYCKCEEEAKAVELSSRRIAYVSYQSPFEIGGASVRGLVEDAQTQEDVIGVLNNFSGDLETAKLAVANNPLARNAIWLDDNNLQKLIDALPPARQSQAFVDFGFYAEWGQSEGFR